MYIFVGVLLKFLDDEDIPLWHIKFVDADSEDLEEHVVCNSIKLYKKMNGPQKKT